MFIASNTESMRKVNEMSDHVGLHSVSVLYVILQYSFIHVTMATDGDVNFPE